MRYKRISGYVLPVAMTVLSVLTFNMLGVMEASLVEGKKAKNEQVRLTLKQIATLELQAQVEALKSNKAPFLKKSNTTLTPIHYPSGCTSSGKDTICQTVTLNFLKNKKIDPPPVLSASPDLWEARQYELISRAENITMGAEAVVARELSYVHIHLALGLYGVPDTLTLNASRDEVRGAINYYFPDWWDYTLYPPPARIACIGPSFSFNPLWLVNAWVTLGGFLLQPTLSTEARCHIVWKDIDGVRRTWTSPKITLMNGQRHVFVGPRGASNYQFSWQAWVVPGAAKYNPSCFWDCFVPGWESIEYDQRGFPDRRNYIPMFPNPLKPELCLMISGSLLQLGKTKMCPLEILDHPTTLTVYKMMPR